MNYQILILTFLLVFTLGCALRALLSPLAKGIRRFLAVPLSFLICYLLQYFGLFATLGVFVEGILEEQPLIGELLVASPYLTGLLEGTVSAVASAILFPIVFVLIYFVLRGVLKAIFDRLLLRLLDRPTSNRIITVARRTGVTLLGAVGGLLISAVLLMPVFYTFTFGTALVNCARVPCDEEIPLREELIVIDEELVTPYEQSGAVHFYDALGLCDLMCHTAELGGRTEIDGKMLYAGDTIRNVLNHAPHIYVHMEAWTVSDEWMVEDFVAFSEDDLIIGAIADIIKHEAAAFAAGEDGIFLHPETNDTTSAYILEVFAVTYANATHEEIEDDLRVVLRAGSHLAENNFFNDFANNLARTESEEQAMATVLIKNLRFVGKAMDALYTADPEHKLSDTLFDILMHNEDVQAFISAETIAELNRKVETGETTYESFTTFLQNMLDLVSDQVIG